MNNDNPNDVQQSVQESQPLQASPTQLIQPAPPANQTAPLQDTNNGNTSATLLVVLLVFSFLVPGLGFFTLPLIIYFALKGVGGKGKFSELDTSHKLIKIIGWISIAIVVAFVGLMTLIFVVLASGNFKIG